MTDHVKNPVIYQLLEPEKTASLQRGVMMINT